MANPVVDYPNGPLTLLSNRALISASDPAVENPDSAPFGGTLNSGCGGEILGGTEQTSAIQPPNELPNDFAQTLETNGLSESWPDAKAYSPVQIYSTGAYVRYGGTLYISKNDDNQGWQPDVSPLYWKALN